MLIKENEFEELAYLRIILASRRKIIFSETEYSICFGYAFLETLKSIVKLPFILYGIFLKVLNELKQNIPKSLDIIRILFWYNDYYLNNNDFIKKVRKHFYNNLIDVNKEIQIKEIHDFSFVYPNGCKKGTPYKNCYEFLYRFIDELKEDSFLFEILYLLDSDTASNRLYKNVRTFQLSLLTLTEIKDHLRCIIPDVVIRKFHSKNDESNGSFFPLYGIIECFEGTLYEMDEKKLNFILVENEDNKCNYTMPLIMLFLHELLGHAKHRLDNNNSMSPSHYYNPHDNYKLCYHCFLGESGRLFEFYISPEIEIIKYLKFSLSSNEELLSIKLWVANDLKELREMVKQKIIETKFECKRDIKDFPNGVEDVNAQFSNGDETDAYLSDYAQDFYENDRELNSYIRTGRKIISCV